jgi:hypothetical protein
MVTGSRVHLLHYMSTSILFFVAAIIWHIHFTLGVLAHEVVATSWASLS